MSASPFFIHNTLGPVKSLPAQLWCLESPSSRALIIDRRRHPLVNDIFLISTEICLMHSRWPIPEIRHMCAPYVSETLLVTNQWVFTIATCLQNNHFQLHKWRLYFVLKSSSPMALLLPQHLSTPISCSVKGAQDFTTTPPAHVLYIYSLQESRQHSWCGG